MGSTLLLPALAAAETDGKIIHEQGGTGLAVVAGTVEVAATRFPCATCHGKDAAGGGEGGNKAPSIRWDVLTRATPARPAYDTDSFARAISDGLNPDGRALSQAMPRYRLPPAEIAALIAYLGSDDLARPPGLYPDRLVIAATGQSALDRGVSRGLAEAGDLAYGRQIVVEAGGESSFRLTELEAVFGEVARRHLTEAMMDRLVKDRVSRLRIVGNDVDWIVPAIEAAGIRPDPDAPDGLIVGPGRMDGLRRAYAMALWLPQDLVARPPLGLEQMILLHMGDADIRTALQAGEGLDFLRGLTLGKAIYAAALLGSRNLSPNGLSSHLEQAVIGIPVSDVILTPE